MQASNIETTVLDVARQPDGQLRLSCARAHVLAEDQGVTLAEIGEICQRHNIKIINCQLGCFGEHKSCA